MSIIRSRRTAPGAVRRMGRRAAPVAILLAAVPAAAAPARAQTFALAMRGALDGRSALVAGGTATPFAGPTPFTLTATFDTRGPNLVAPLPFPGFVAYTPSLVELTLGGRTYTVQPFGAASPLGVSVAIFDAATPFYPGRYGVGLIQDPLADGAGFVADYLGASPAFTLAAGRVVPTTFTGYAGVGVSSGVCLVGTPPSCPKAVTPVPMTWAGQAFALQLGDYEEDGSPDGLPFTATISAVPEPGSLALVAAGLAGAAAAGRRRSRRGGQRLTP